MLGLRPLYWIDACEAGRGGPMLQDIGGVHTKQGCHVSELVTATQHTKTNQHWEHLLHAQAGSASLRKSEHATLDVLLPLVVLI